MARAVDPCQGTAVLSSSGPVVDGVNMILRGRRRRVRCGHHHDVPGVLSLDQRDTAHNDGEVPNNVSAEPDPAESRPETSTIRDRHVLTWRHAVRPRPFPGAVYKVSRGENQWKHTVVDAEHPGRRAGRSPPYGRTPRSGREVAVVTPGTEGDSSQTIERDWGHAELTQTGVATSRPKRCSAGRRPGRCR